MADPSLCFFFLFISIFSDFFKIMSLFRLCWVIIAASRPFLVTARGDYSLVVVHGLLLVVASFVAEHRLLSTRAQ